MGHSEAKKEHSEHEELLNLLKKHFAKDEEDIEELDETFGGPMKKFKGLQKGRGGSEKPFDSSSDDVDDDIDHGYGSDEIDDDSLESESAEAGDEDDKGEGKSAGEELEEIFDDVPKDKRKRLAISAISKKMSKPKSA